MRTILVAALMLAGCHGAAPAPKPTASSVVNPAPLRSISIGYGGCEGTCPIFTVTVEASGKGVFEGEHFTAVNGKRSFAITPGQFDKVVAALAPFRLTQSRPISDVISKPDARHCDSYATDFPGRFVTWTEADGSAWALDWDTGCKAKRYEGLQLAIDQALALFPVAAWVGPDH